jgi:hypothetical protein
MRRFLAIVIAFQCARLAAGGTLPLSGKDIVVMLRMGYSNEDIMRDLSKKHFVGALDSKVEGEMRQLNASPQLLDALRSGQFDATTDELTQAQQKIAAANAAAEELARQQQVALQDAAARVSNARRSQELAHPASQQIKQIIDLEIGHSLDLREFAGPNIRLIVNAVEMDDLMITLLDYDHMLVVGVQGPAGLYGGWGLTGISNVPTATHKRVEKENNSLLYRWGHSKLVYLDVMDTSINHVKVGIVSE